MKNSITRAVKKVLRDKSKNVKAIARNIKEYEAQKLAAEEAKKPKYEGRKNESINEFFAELCCLTQGELKSVLPALLRQRNYKDIIVEDGFIYAKGDVPVVLTAHLDTVHKNPIVDYYEKTNERGDHIIYSPQGIGGDDRCGVYMILRIVEKFKCSVVFCEDEESGCIGSKKFCKTEYIKDLSECNYMIGLDRAHANDAVFYDCDNREFVEFISENIGYKEEFGSFSDISYLAPKAGIAAVNLSCGYYSAHTTSEYVNIEEMEDTIDAVLFLLDQKDKRFEYIEKKYSYKDYYFGGDGYGYYGSTAYTNGMIGICAYYNDPDGKEDAIFAEGGSEAECWGRIFMENPDLCMNDITDYEFY